MTLRHIISPEERRKILKEKLDSGKFIRGIEVHNAISALINNELQVEVLANNEKKINEFDFFWESSLTDSASKGYPDIEIVSFDSRLKTISEILEVTDKPIIVDGDTGGDIHHFEYLIPKLEMAGVSAVIIEDKVFPKRNSLESGTLQTQEEPEKFAEKIRVGKNIQRSKDFMIIARIESLIAGKNVEDALIRTKKYFEAGVDGIMIHSKSSDPSEIFEFAKKYRDLCKEINLKKPLVCVPTTYNSVYESEFIDRGFNVVIYANHMLRASVKAMKEVAKTILKNERSLETDPHIVPVREIFEKVGFLDVKEKDEKLSSIPSVILPAAGENPELKNILGGLPKPMLKIAGKTILERQINQFNNLGIKDINVVVGYQKQKFSNVSGVNFIENKEHNSKGILHSIILAKDKMKKGFIYMNADNIIDERLLGELLDRKEDIVIVVDNSYEYHRHEIDKRLDAVITKMGNKPSYQRLRYPDDEVVLIGANISKDNMTHEHIGLGKFSKKGAENLIKVYQDCLERNSNGKFHGAENFDKADMMDILQELIDRGFKIHVHETSGGWIEVHNEKDIKTAERIFGSDSFN